MPTSKTPDFLAPLRFQCKQSPCLFENAEVNTRYYWRVEGGAHRSFCIADTYPRFIHLDGVLNVRDLAGKCVKQWLVYRGSKIDRHFPLSKQGLKTFRETLGIRTELDLRGAHEIGGYPHLEDSDIRLVHLPFRPYLETFEAANKRLLCEIMYLFTEKKNYPVYIHCFGGADRTGMIAFFLKALCGEREEDIHLDYEMTTLSLYAGGLQEGATGLRSRNAPYYKEFLQKLATFAPGRSLHEQVRAFLVDCGVSVRAMDAIVTILKK